MLHYTFHVSTLQELSFTDGFITVTMVCILYWRCRVLRFLRQNCFCVVRMIKRCTVDHAWMDRCGGRQLFWLMLILGRHVSGCCSISFENKKFAASLMLVELCSNGSWRRLAEARKCCYSGELFTDAASDADSPHRQQCPWKSRRTPWWELKKVELQMSESEPLTSQDVIIGNWCHLREVTMTNCKLRT